MLETKKADREFEFTSADFARTRALIHHHAGISLADTKSELVYGRLSRNLRNTGSKSFKEYLDILENNPSKGAIEEFVNALTTNLTYFFREDHHFDVLAEQLPTLQAPINIWCCAASTGEEPYSIAMTACETFGTVTPPIRILATDIDTKVLEVAESGIYSLERISKLSRERRDQFFLKGTGKQDGFVKIRPELRSLIQFEPFNLLSPRWNFDRPFDVIFCRNVMIYFDKTTQTKVLNLFPSIMKPHSLIFFGHSENFMYQSHNLKPIGKTVYKLR